MKNIGSKMAGVNDIVQVVPLPHPKRKNFRDLTGQRFERLVAKFYVGSSGKHKQSTWFCVCDCGNSVLAINGNLRSGQTNSCGCYQSDAASNAGRTHGLSKTVEYKILLGAKKRCYDENNQDYENYGGRGIQVRITTEELIAEIGLRPSYEFSLDRLDNDKHYESGNLRWATSYEQSINRRNTHLVLGLPMVEQAKSNGLSIQTVASRLNRYGWCELCAVTLPRRSSCTHRSKDKC